MAITKLTNEYFVHPKLKEVLDISVQDLADEDDSVIIITGAEGAGKSILAQQIGGYMAKKTKQKFTVHNIHFSSQDFQNESLNNGKKHINILDESRSSINKMRGNSKSNVEFNNFLSECRDSNQVHIILLPAFTDLDRYVAIWRSKVVIDVKKYRHPKTKRIVRGSYNIINTGNKSQLNEAWEGKYKGFPNRMVWAKCTFTNASPIDKEEYRAKKAEHRKQKYAAEEDGGENKEVIKLKQRLEQEKERVIILTKLLSNNYSQKIIAQKIKYSSSYLSEMITKFDNRSHTLDTEQSVKS